MCGASVVCVYHMCWIREHVCAESSMHHTMDISDRLFGQFYFALYSLAYLPTRSRQNLQDEKVERCECGIRKQTHTHTHDCNVFAAMRSTTNAKNAWNIVCCQLRAQRQCHTSHVCECTCRATASRRSNYIYRSTIVGKRCTSGRRRLVRNANRSTHIHFSLSLRLRFIRLPRSLRHLCPHFCVHEWKIVTLCRRINT